MKVKIVDIHQDDQYYADNIRFIGQVGIFILHKLHDDGYASGRFTNTGTSNLFYKVKVTELGTDGKEVSAMRIAEVLMKRDGMSREEAEEQIEEAKEALSAYIASGDFLAAEEVCAEYFGLEPDYLMELMP